MHNLSGYMIHSMDQQQGPPIKYKVSFNTNSFLAPKSNLCLSSDCHSGFTMWGLKSLYFLKGQIVGHGLRNGYRHLSQDSFHLIFLRHTALCKFTSFWQSLWSKSLLLLQYIFLCLFRTPPCILRPNYANKCLGFYDIDTLEKY